MKVFISNFGKVSKLTHAMVLTPSSSPVYQEILGVDKWLECLFMYILDRIDSQLSKHFKMTIKGVRCYYRDKKFDIEQEKYQISDQ